MLKLILGLLVLISGSAQAVEQVDWCAQAMRKGPKSMFFSALPLVMRAPGRNSDLYLKDHGCSDACGLHAFVALTEAALDRESVATPLSVEYPYTYHLLFKAFRAIYGAAGAQRSGISFEESLALLQRYGSVTEIGWKPLKSLVADSVHLEEQIADIAERTIRDVSMIAPDEARARREQAIAEVETLLMTYTGPMPQAIEYHPFYGAPSADSTKTVYDRVDPMRFAMLYLPQFFGPVQRYQLTTDVAETQSVDISFGGPDAVYFYDGLDAPIYTHVDVSTRKILLKQAPAIVERLVAHQNEVYFEYWEPTNLDPVKFEHGILEAIALGPDRGILQAVTMLEAKHVGPRTVYKAQTSGAKKIIYFDDQFLKQYGHAFYVLSHVSRQ